ncbi:AraC family transcriptional regulator [Streptomyces inusitatus]|uniref:AraC family transcriptional regulator n=1 Tax=Streptomyces inusitatus TaxID=68221 RepID=A0A918QK88_9ACTN|nr:helix-turn-helix domain-containing protein [Streptomyces inusitatus]GGZ51263.1 AraC family transcriptional regulator [Streptomyces inusitatus]
MAGHPHPPPGPPHLAFSTGTMPPKERAAAWQRALSQCYVTVEAAIGAAPEAWSGSLTAHWTGTLRITADMSGPARVRRTPDSVAADGRTYVFARTQLEGSVRLVQDGRTAHLTPGALAFHDAARPFALALPEPQRAHVLTVPRQLLRVDDATLRDITAIPVTETSGASAALLLPLVHGLVREAADADSPYGSEELSRTVVGLLAALAAHLAAEADRPGAGWGQVSLLERIKTAAGARLGEPGLSPRALAEEHHISPRYLHKLFRAEGTTFGRWVLGRRLSECRAELERADRDHLPVAAVAARWGFSSPARFSDAFRAAYGEPPGRWRESARARQNSVGP